MLMGTAKPMPTEPWLVPPVAIWELMPITRPSPSSSGPPELPGLIAASVWITLRIGKPSGAWIWRASAETMPVVTVRVKPKGLPMAITGSPTSACEESPSGIGSRPPSTSRGIDLQGREVGGRIDALDLGVHLLAVLGEAHADALGAGDDVGVGDDRALLVDHEARAGGGALLGRAEGRLALALAHALGGDERDPASFLLVDVAHGAAVAVVRPPSA